MITRNIRGHSPLPDETYIDKSSIHGMGVFARRPLSSGHDFGITHIVDSRFPDSYIRTPFGGFINHSFQPNCEIYEDEDTLHIRTIKHIEAGEELTVDYRPYYTDEEVSQFH